VASNILALNLFEKIIHSGQALKNMTTKIKSTVGYIITALALAGFAVSVALADIQQIPFTVKTASGSGCPGAYTGYAKMTNSAGSIWVTPPTNTTSGTFTDASGFGAPYVSVACVDRRSDGVSWCGTNSVTFPATNSTSYQLMIVVKSTPPPPTNGQPITLQITWQ
jgi:hypothetical protein